MTGRVLVGVDKICVVVISQKDVARCEKGAQHLDACKYVHIRLPNIDQYVVNVIKSIGEPAGRQAGRISSPQLHLTKSDIR